MSQSQSTVVAHREWWTSAEADPDFPCHAECEIIHVEEAVHDLLLYAKTWPKESEERFAVSREGDVRHVGTPNEAFLKLYQSLCWLGLVSSSQISDVMEREAAQAAVVQQKAVADGIPDDSSPNGKERLDMIALSVLRDLPHREMWSADDLAMTLKIPRAASQASLCRLHDAGMLAERTDGSFYLLEEFDWETFDRDNGEQPRPDERCQAVRDAELRDAEHDEPSGAGQASVAGQAPDVERGDTDASGDRSQAQTDEPAEAAAG